MAARTITVIGVLLVACARSEAKDPVEARWSEEVTGQTYLEDMSPQQARTYCLARAKADAVEQVAGVKVYSQTLMKDAAVVGDLLTMESHAWVSDTKDVRWETETIQKRPEELPMVLYRVRLKALVEVDRDRDENFTLQVWLDREAYETNDEMVIDVQSGQDAYLTIFNVLQDGTVNVLLPDNLPKEYKMTRKVEKGQKVRYPEPGSRVRLKPIKVSKSTTTTESIVVVATIDDVDLVGDDFKPPGSSDPNETKLVHHLLRKLLEVAPSRRALAVETYQLRVKGRD